MARVGRFGRLPRSQPSLTNTIVALAREFQQSRDRNIMDAWKNGGEFEGGPATDERVLEYWRGRLDGISPKDPLHDQYSNTILQFEYAVEESKNSLLYAQGKITDAQRAQFFLDWAKKVPPDTEFYRILQRNAAQFAERIRATVRSSGTRARAAASGQASAATANRYEAVGNYLTDVLTKFAQDQQFIAGNDDLSDLAFYTNNGPARMIELINRLNASPELLAYVKKIDPTFSGTITFDYYQQALKNQVTGLTERYRRALAEGRMGTSNGVPGATALKNDLDDLITFAGKSAMWDSATTYLELRKAFLVVWEDGSSSPTEKLKAWQKYRDGLVGLANDPNNPVDAATKTTLMAEATLNTSIDSWYENFTRATSIGTPKTGGDIAETRVSIANFIREYDQVNDGTGASVWTYGVRDRNGVFTPQAGGTVIGATTMIEAQQAGARAVVIPQNDGSFSTVYVRPAPVTAVARDAAGNLIPPVTKTTSGQIVEGSPIIGQTLDVYVGGELIRVYGYQATDGTTRYTTVAPWGGGVRELPNRDGSISIDVSPAAQAGKGMVPIFDTDGVQVGFGFNPGQASIDTIRNTAGINEKLDFLTPMLAVLQATVDGQAKLANLANDAELRRVLEQDGLAAMTLPTGRLDVNSWNKFTQQLDLQSAVGGSLRAEDDPAGFGYDNTTIASAVAGVGETFASKPFNVGSEEWAKRNGEFVPLAQVMDLPGQLGIPPAGTPSTAPQITLGPELLLPQVPMIAPGQATPTGPSYMTPVPAPAPFVAPLPQNVTAPPAPAPAPAPAYTAPATSYPTISWTSPSGTGAIEEEMPTAPINPLEITDPDYWLGLGF